jgi:uncharacterized protein YbbC (DUF1343 family)
MQKIYLFLLACGFSFGAFSQEIKPGAYQTSEYLPALKGKRIGLFANHTATIGNKHLVDTLVSLGMNITKAFGPEHGFRGTADAGEKVGDYKDAATGIPVISLYGKKRRPSADDLQDVDVMLFDIQDVGTRFYTYISSLEEFINSAIENNKPLIILDRPNPNGFYVDGPVLDTAYKSFVGMQPIPMVYGMTMGEYAKMLIGEKWAKAAATASKLPSITIIKNKNYNHKSKYVLPVKPSPNLGTMASVYWYGSNCLFEGTVLSEGRGTDYPFAIFGHPSLPKTLYTFTPKSRDGAKEPKLKDQLCYGWNLAGTDKEVLQKVDSKIQLSYLLEAYKLFPEKEKFFITPKSGKPTDYFFNKLAGNDALHKQIIAGASEKEIRDSWAEGLNTFKKIRKKYLLYTDFE